MTMAAGGGAFPTAGATRSTVGCCRVLFARLSQTGHWSGEQSSAGHRTGFWGSLASSEGGSHPQSQSKDEQSSPGTVAAESTCGMKWQTHKLLGRSMGITAIAISAIRTKTYFPALNPEDSSPGGKGNGSRRTEELTESLRRSLSRRRAKPYILPATHLRRLARRRADRWPVQSGAGTHSMIIEETNRREFLEAAGAVAAVATTGTASAASQPAAKPWYQTAWRRAVIDMHIPDWNPQFLSKFDPDEYVARLKESRAQSIVCYAQSHVGLFNYPTKVGKQHAAFAGRDIVAELMERCRAQGIAVVLYASLIHDRWAYDQHPDWRMLRADGKPISEGGRHGLVCPNSPYREYVRRWVDEMARRFDAEGFRFDMTFWVGVCHCPHCKARWDKESKQPWPTTIDWTDERWTSFAHRREEWLADFAAICTNGVRAVWPNASVEHQASTLPLNWRFGVGLPLVKHNDFLQGDFYGDALQGSFVRKLLGELTPKKPFGFETSFSLRLADHTGRKSEALLEAKASAAIADHAAFVFIDAIDPIGTVNPICHQRMGKVFDRLKRYYEHLGGARVADVAIYYSLDSKFSMKTNGRPISQEDGSDDHTEAAMNVARRLIAGHIPFTVITKKDLGRLGEFKAIMLPNIHHMDDGEAAAIREYVRNGGAIFASGGTSLISTSGKRRSDFALADVFGVFCINARWDERRRYLAPTLFGRPPGSSMNGRRNTQRSSKGLASMWRRSRAPLSWRPAPFRGRRNRRASFRASTAIRPGSRRRIPKSRRMPSARGRRSTRRV